MKLKWIAIAGIVLGAVRLHAATSPRVDTQKQKLSYAMGVSMARHFKCPGIELDMDLLGRGLKDGFSGRDFLMAGTISSRR